MTPHMKTYTTLCGHLERVFRNSVRGEKSFGQMIKHFLIACLLSRKTTNSISCCSDHAAVFYIVFSVL